MVAAVIPIVISTDPMRISSSDRPSQMLATVAMGHVDSVLPIAVGINPMWLIEIGVWIRPHVPIHHGPRPTAAPMTDIVPIVVIIVGSPSAMLD